MRVCVGGGAACLPARRVGRLLGSGFRQRYGSVRKPCSAGSKATGSDTMGADGGGDTQECREEDEEERRTAERREGEEQEMLLRTDNRSDAELSVSLESESRTESEMNKKPKRCDLSSSLSISPSFFVLFHHFFLHG